MSAEQAQEAHSIQQESNAATDKPSVDAGLSSEKLEEEVGNFRVSPHPPQAKGKVMQQEGVEHG